MGFRELGYLFPIAVEVTVALFPNLHTYPVASGLTMPIKVDDVESFLRILRKSVSGEDTLEMGGRSSVFFQSHFYLPRIHFSSRIVVHNHLFGRLNFHLSIVFGIYNHLYWICFSNSNMSINFQTLSLCRFEA